MLLPCIPARSVARATVLFAGAILSGSAILTALAARPDQPGSDSVGLIEGESIAVNGPMRVEVVGGQARARFTRASSAGHCVCELQTAKAAPAPQLEISRPATAEEVRKNALDAKADPPTPAEKPAVKEEPIYQVFMPPLIYDVKTKVQPEVDPKMIVLVRGVRVRPTLIFQGRVEGEMIAAATPALPSAPASGASGNPRKAATPANDSFIGRVRNFVRKLWSRGA